MDKKSLKADSRKITGRKVKTLRKEGLLPGNVYGKKLKSVALQVNYKEFVNLYKEVGETGLFDLVLGSDIKPVLIHNVQTNSKTDTILHVDFLQVDLKVKVTAEVPVELIGESPAAKQGIGTVVQQLNEVEVEALPADLPEKFEVNVEELVDVDQAIYVKDLKIDSKIEIKTDPELIIVNVSPPQKEEVVETPIVPVGAEGEITQETDNQTQDNENKNPEAAS